MNKTARYNNDQTLSYADFGDSSGFPILIQHGMIASINDQHLFQSLIDLGARLISIARPGYGASSPYVMQSIGEWGQIVATLVDQLGLAQFDVLGISSGAPYSYAIAYHLPERVRNVYILSGTPALYDEQVQAAWPYPIDQHAALGDLQALAYALFFAGLPAADRIRDDIRDSMMNDCFGIAQDLKIRCLDWGFPLADLKASVSMRHSRADDAVPLITAQRTAQLLPNCGLEIREHDAHFSRDVLDDFICTVIAGNLAHE